MKNECLTFFKFFWLEKSYFYTVFEEKLTIWGPKIFFSKNQDVISKIGFLEAFTICFGNTHLKGEVLSPRFEKQVHFWNWGSFHPFSKAVQLKMVKINFSSQNFDFYRNSQRCRISLTVLRKRVLDVPEHFSSHLGSHSWV